MTAARPLDQALLDSALMEIGCARGEHDWKFIGCRPCCCNLGDGLEGECSIPVHVCEHCSDCDYGENEEAERIKEACDKEWQ